MYETVVVPGPQQTFVYQRVAGTAESVAAYLMTLADIDPASLSVLGSP